ncbi:three-helix bundle dimerization domain-containing protein [Kytococcus sp. Marseille-QA3725]
MLQRPVEPANRLSAQLAGPFFREEVATVLQQVRREMESTATVTDHIPVLAEREVHDLTSSACAPRKESWNLDAWRPTCPTRP